MKTKSQEKRTKKSCKGCTPSRTCHCSSKNSGIQDQKKALGLDYRVKLFLLKCLLLFKQGKRPVTVTHLKGTSLGRTTSRTFLKMEET